MSVHIEAKQGEIAERILLPGDPLRAQFISENFLQGAKRYNNVRGMLGFTGTYKGMPVSVQGTGMGIPSISIYVTELFNEYGVQKAIRVGTAGSLVKDVPLRSVVLAMSACTDSGIINSSFRGMHYAPTANWDLLKAAYDAAIAKSITPKVSSVVSTDVFYDEDESWKMWAKYGVSAVEMEAAALYTIAAKFGRQALAILTISDSLVTGEKTTSQERQETFTDTVKVNTRVI